MPTMPLSSYDTTANLNARDVSKAFYMIKKEETPFFNKIPIVSPAFNTRHVWWDDARLIRGSTIGTQYAFGTPTAMILASTSGLRTGSVLEVANRIYRVASVTNGTTLVVAYIGGSANDANHTVGSVVNFVGNTAKEGEDYADTDYNFEVERFNLTQIFTDYVKITGTDRAVRREVNDGDLLLQITQKKLERLYLVLARAVWANPIVTAPTDNTTARVMGGVDAYLAANGINVTTATAITDVAFDNWLLNLDKAGANLTELWMNPLDLGKFAGIDSTKLQVQRQDETRGIYVNKYISKYGHELTLNTDIQAPSGKIRAIRSQDVGLAPLNGRSFQIQDLDKTGDNDKKMLVGEYTLEVRNSAIAGYYVPT
jgi:hypothetical protein